MSSPRNDLQAMYNKLMEQVDQMKSTINTLVPEEAQKFEKFIAALNKNLLDFKSKAIMEGGITPSKDERQKMVEGLKEATNLIDNKINPYLEAVHAKKQGITQKGPSVDELKGEVEEHINRFTK